MRRHRDGNSLKFSHWGGGAGKADHAKCSRDSICRNSMQGLRRFCNRLRIEVATYSSVQKIVAVNSFFLRGVCRHSRGEWPESCHDRCITHVAKSRHRNLSATQMD
jgi:hypothetical protein